MTATDFTIYHGAYDPPLYLTINTVEPMARKAALRQILRDYPEAECIHLTCWYEGTLPMPPEPTTPLIIRRR
jgi:hypothetical protein